MVITLITIVSVLSTPPYRLATSDIGVIEISTQYLIVNIHCRWPSSNSYL